MQDHSRLADCYVSLMLLAIGKDEGLRAALMCERELAMGDTHVDPMCAYREPIECYRWPICGEPWGNAEAVQMGKWPQAKQAFGDTLDEKASRPQLDEADALGDQLFE